MSDVREAYDNWSTKYDSDRNLTRDLNSLITKQTFVDSQFNSIVEIGCGTGKNTLFLAQIGTQVQAMDFSEAMLNKAKKKLNSDNVAFLIGDITKIWTYSDRSADLITCNLVLEHIKDLSFVFSEAFRILTAGGTFFVSELHPFKQYTGAKANFQNGAETVEISSYVHHISEFFDTAKNNGFIVEDFKEWWHETDMNKLPRLATFRFRK